MTAILYLDDNTIYTIVDYLNYDDIIALTLTCKYISSLFSKPTFWLRWQCQDKHEYLIYCLRKRNQASIYFLNLINPLILIERALLTRNYRYLCKYIKRCIDDKVIYVNLHGTMDNIIHDIYIYALHYNDRDLVHAMKEYPIAKRFYCLKMRIRVLMHTTTDTSVGQCLKHMNSTLEDYLYLFNCHNKSRGIGDIYYNMGCNADYRELNTVDKTRIKDVYFGAKDAGNHDMVDLLKIFLIMNN